jgi:hypothetical protein
VGGWALSGMSFFFPLLQLWCKFSIGSCKHWPSVLSFSFLFFLFSFHVLVSCLSNVHLSSLLLLWTLLRSSHSVGLCQLFDRAQEYWVNKQYSYACQHQNLCTVCTINNKTYPHYYPLICPVFGRRAEG